MLLNILISTIDNRIEQVKNVLLEYRDDVQYIISHQYSNEKYKNFPHELVRNDVLISQIPGKGVARSRNNAISVATGDIGLFSDDDVIYTYDDFDSVLNIFAKDPSLDVVVFKIKTPPEKPEYKKYPKYPVKLVSLPFSVGTIEIAFKVKEIQKNEILFDERFGAGNSLLIGSDENIFILDCIKNGLNVWFYPIYIVQHPYESTIKTISKYDKRRISVAGAYDTRVNGWISIPKAFTDTIRIFPDLIRNKKNPIIYLLQRLAASFYILFTKSK